MSATARSAEPGSAPQEREASLEARPRERLLRTAYELFCRHGVGATGVDRIVVESGVAKRTLYRHFHSKDELVRSALERRERLWTRGWLEREVERRGRTPEERLLAIFELLDEWFRREDYEGCFFINSLLESHDRTSPIGGASATQLANVRSFLRRLAAQTSARDPDGLARQWQTLMAGAIVLAAQGDIHAAQAARDVASSLLERERQAS